jgi:hypothetical protein
LTVEPTVRQLGAKSAEVVGFNYLPALETRMDCHYCDADADVVVEKDGIRVGVCENHFREQMEELADSDLMDGLEEQLDVDRAE